MVKLSILVYTLIELREAARNGKLEGPSLQILNVPLPMDKALSIIATEADLLKEILSEGDHQMALSALSALLAGDADTNRAAALTSDEDGKDSSALCGLLDAFNICWPSSNKDVASPEDSDNYTISTLTAIGDDNSADQLVYVVGINPKEKRITVAFRGSTTKNDFLTDAKMDMVSVPDPQTFQQCQADNNNDDASKSKDKVVESDICIHKGFYEYLFTAKNNDGRNKYEEIMTHVTNLFNSNPQYMAEYKLYVTGHSLGGALATLFGFYAAASTLPSPVTIVSVASPRVGNLHFAACFTEYESQGKLRHLRIANHRDPVTLGPSVSSKRMLTMGAMVFSPLGYLALKLSGNTAGKDESYYHCGMKMKLRDGTTEEERKCELVYSGAMFLPKEEQDEVGDATDEDVVGKKSSASSMKLSTSDMPLVSHHFGKAYADRMASVEGELEGMTLNNLYKTKTGNDTTVDASF
jgi:hypothetical protein